MKKSFKLKQHGWTSNAVPGMFACYNGLHLCAVVTCRLPRDMMA